MSTIAVIRAERQARTLKGGAWVTGRVYADFVIDGRPLSQLVSIKADLISALGWGPEAERRAVADRLLLRAPPDLPNGRNSLYACPECGDLGCGAVSAIIERKTNDVTWRAFAFENTWDPAGPDTKHLEKLTSYTFPWAQYEAAVEAGLAMDGG